MKAGTLTAVLMAAALAAGSSVAATPPAHAAASCPGVGTVLAGGGVANGCVDADAGLNSRRHIGRTSAVTYADPVLWTYPYGTRVLIDCYFTGPPVTGPYGTTTIWDDVTVYQLPGATDSITLQSPGIYAVSSDAWIYTGTNSPVARHC